MVKSDDAVEFTFKCFSVFEKLSLFLLSSQPPRLASLSIYEMFWCVKSIFELMKLFVVGDKRADVIFDRIRGDDAVSTIVGLEFDDDDELSSDKLYSVLIVRPITGINCCCGLIEANLIDLSTLYFTFDFSLN